MKKLIQSLIIGLLASLLSDCARVPYGSYIQIEHSVSNKMAQDASRVLARQFLPAKTRIQLINPAKDTFGMSLVQALRETGYAVIEAQPKAASNQSTLDTVALGFVLDAPKSTNLNRLSLFADSLVLSRVYVVDKGKVLSASTWSIQENPND